eukprot:5720321-Prymnesium_polylepis.1
MASGFDPADSVPEPRSARSTLLSLTRLQVIDECQRRLSNEFDLPTTQRPRPDAHDRVVISTWCCRGSPSFKVDTAR